MYAVESSFYRIFVSSLVICDQGDFKVDVKISESSFEAPCGNFRKVMAVVLFPKADSFPNILLFLKLAIDMTVSFDIAQCL